MLNLFKKLFQDVFCVWVSTIHNHGDTVIISSIWYISVYYNSTSEQKTRRQKKKPIKQNKPTKTSYLHPKFKFLTIYDKNMIIRFSVNESVE